MADSWDEIARKAFNDPNEPILADATNLTKFGAPAVAIIAALLTGLVGSAVNLDVNRPEVVIASAVIIASTLLGIYAAFASDIRARADVTQSRFEALATILGEDFERIAGDAQRTSDLEAARATAKTATEDRATMEIQLTEANALLKECRAAREISEADKLKQQVTDLEGELETCRAALAHAASESAKDGDNSAPTRPSLHVEFRREVRFAPGAHDSQ